MLYQAISLVGNHVCAHANDSQTNMLIPKWSKHLCTVCYLWGSDIDAEEYGNNCKCYLTGECALIIKLLCRGIGSLIGPEWDA